MAALTEARVRLFLRDNTADDNYLLDDVEFTEDEIDAAMEACVDEWNETTPDIGVYTYENFPYRHYWLVGTKGHLFSIAAANYARNNLTYSAGGITIDDKNKMKQYQAMADRYTNEWKQWLHDRMRAGNAVNGFTTFVSR